MNRRGFMAAILCAGVAPAVVRAASLMPVRQLDNGIVLPWGDTPLTMISTFDRYPLIDFDAVYRVIGKQMLRTIEESAFLALTGRKYGA